MKRAALLLGSVLFAAAMGCAAFAATPNVEASMLVTGTITVNPQGGVQSYAMQDLDKLPPSVRQIIQTTVPRWRFVPIMADGNAVTAKAGMSLRIVADMVDAQHATVSIAGAAFGCDARPKSNLPGECPAGTAVRYVHRQPPDYPMAAARAGVGGEVFLVVQIGRDGHVTQTAVRQVNLYRLTEEPEHYRKMLAEASLRAARNWQFSIPTTGPNAAKDHWIVQVPINYTMNGVPSDACGSIPCRSPRAYAWRAYIPGPVQGIPWDHEDTSGASRTSADAIASGGLFIRDTRFILKTALQTAAADPDCGRFTRGSPMRRTACVGTRSAGRPLDCADARSTDIHSHCRCRQRFSIARVRRACAGVQRAGGVDRRRQRVA